MNAKTETQKQFEDKFREQFGIELNWDRYYINRGRGWSKSDGTCGACIYDTDGKEYCFNGGLRRYLSKKYHFYIAYDTINRCQTPELFLAWYDKNGKEIIE